MNDLIAFVKSRNKTGEFGRFVELVGEQTSYVVAIEILNWLRRQKRFKNEKDLELNVQQSWCQALPALLDAEPSLARLFEIVGDRLRFRSEINTAERQKVRELAYVEYQPTVRI